MFLPTTPQELEQLGWDRLDVILVSGDSYIDSPFAGAAVIGRSLLQAGYRVGIIAQPRLDSGEDILRLGEPALFWGVTAGCVDSMVANYTASRKKRRSDDYTPGGINNRRPDRAVIAYTNLIRRHFKNTCPIVLGGIEASLRRVVHYDYWTDRLRGSVLFDAKADFLVYGMGETTTLALARRLQEGKDYRDLRGLCYPAKEARDGYLELPSLAECVQDKQVFTKMFHLFYRNNDPLSAKGLSQRHGERFLIQNPPAYPLSQEELDGVYALDYQRAQHPYYEKQGKVKALETIRFSLSTHRGCYGECSFCAIAVHEGRTVSWRSPDSILAEAERFSAHPEYKSIIFDAGGPTANMYGFECDKKLKHGVCPAKRCVYPRVCDRLEVDQGAHLELLKRLRKTPGVKKVFVASGLRYDLMLADEHKGRAYLQELVEHHVSGQMKVAPEHSVPYILEKMGKPPVHSLLEFKKLFDSLSRAAGKQQFLTYYMIAAHPGCTEQDMRRLKEFAGRELQISPEQVQIFTPTPSTYSSLMYYTESDPFTGQPLFVEKDLRRKERQKEIVVQKPGVGRKKGA